VWGCGPGTGPSGWCRVAVHFDSSNELIENIEALLDVSK
jgi:hypothetical protein